MRGRQEGESLGPSLGQTRARGGGDAGLISTGCLPTRLPPPVSLGLRSQEGSPRGKHGLSVLLRGFPLPRHPLMLPGRSGSQAQGLYDGAHWVSEGCLVPDSSRGSPDIVGFL